MSLPTRPALMLAVLVTTLTFWLASLALAPMAAALPAASIQSLIDDAPDGGTVLVAAGVYPESLTISKNITLTGSGSTSTEIRAVAGQRAITVTSSHNLWLYDLKIAGGNPEDEVGGGVKMGTGQLYADGIWLEGNAAAYGGAIYSDGSDHSVQLWRSRVENNTAAVDGGGVYSKGQVEVLYSDVLSNTAGRHGGGISSVASMAGLHWSRFVNNHAGGNGGAANINDWVFSIDSTFISNSAGDRGGAINQWNGSRWVDIRWALFERNSAGSDGGALIAGASDGGSPSWIELLDTDLLTNTAGANGGGLRMVVGTTELTGGLYSGNRALGGSGGAVDANGALSVAGSQFISNTAMDGGGVRQTGAESPVDLSGSRFERNVATRSGGGLYADGSITVTASLFMTNTAGSSALPGDSKGGGLHAGGPALVSDSTFQGNRTLSQGGERLGGGLYAASGNARLQHTTFEANSAWIGGGVYAEALLFTSTDSRFVNNSAYYGGGLYARAAKIERSAFVENSAVNEGGGAYVGPTSLDVRDSVFYANYARVGGGAIKEWCGLRAINSAFVNNTSEYSAGYYGDVLSLEQDFARSLEHVTIAHTIQKAGEAIVLKAGSLAITNTIIASYTTGITLSAGASTDSTRILWYNVGQQSTGAGALHQSQSITGTPAFASDGYHLTSPSVARDTGVPSGVKTDIDGNPRPWGIGYDIGAVEYPRGRLFLPLVVRH